MNRQSLPVVDPARSEFGFDRTQCACLECTRSCHHIPGYLVPADLDRVRRFLTPDQDLWAWTKQNLLASPGAIVMSRGQTFRIPTLVPARRPDGACVFLTDASQCAVHSVSPFGCAFFDSHMTHFEADRRSKRGLQAVLEAWDASGLYAHLWVALAGDGLVAPSPELARQQLRQACNEKWPRCKQSMNWPA
jgi:hypothetical protein